MAQRVSARPLTLVHTLHDATARSRLAQALRLDATCGVSWEECGPARLAELQRVVAEQRPAVVVVDPFPDGRLALDDCLRLRRSFDPASIVIYSRFGSGRSRDLLRLAEASFVNFVLQDEDDSPSALRSVLARCRVGQLHAAAWPVISGLAPCELHPVLDFLLRESALPVTPHQLARFAHQHPKTLRERLRRAHLPSTERLIVWFRLFHAGALLSGGASAQGVAGMLEFPSAAALRQQLRTHVGLTPRELTAAGGVQLLLAEFRRRYESRQWRACARLDPA